jgi:hypothetical protein
VPGCLEALAAVAVADGEPEMGAGLLGAAAAFREMRGIVARAPDCERAARTLAAAREALDPAAFASAQGAGRALGWSEVVDRALRLA